MKKVGIILLVIIVLLAVVSALLPSKVHVERSIVISAPVATVFDQVNTLPNWKNWSYWDQIDPNMTSEYEGPRSGTGAVHKWSSENDSVGKGSLTIVESTEPHTITTSLSFDGMGTSAGGWNFDETESGIKTTIYMDIEMSFIGRIVPGLMMDKWLGTDFEKSLVNLKAYSESIPVVKEQTWNVEIVTTVATPVMSMKVSVSGAEFSAKLGESYGKIMEAITKQGLRQTGPVYAVYHKWSENEVQMEPGIPVDKAGKSENEIQATELLPLKAIKVDYFGDYPGTEKAHYYMDGWAKSNNMTIIGPPWEEYVTDPEAEPDTSKWLTRIYYPVQ